MVDTDRTPNGLAAFQRVLVLGPHVDDAEFGCGGAIARLVEQNSEVRCVAFSAAERSVPDGYSTDVLRTEAQEAGRVLKLSALEIKAYPVRDFPAHRQEILEDLIALRGEFQPDLVLLPSTNDIHQDHAVIAAEGLRAFKTCTILGYEMPWNNVSFTTSSMISLEERHIQRKIEALSCYPSQAFRAYADPDFVRALARTRGVQIEAQFAEAFEVLRWVIR